MDYLNIPVPSDTKIAVIGDIHCHNQQFLELLDKIQPSEQMWIISVGDLLNKGFGQEAEDIVVNKFRELVDAKIGFVCKGNHELRNIREARKNNTMTDNLRWLECLPLALSFNFTNQTKLTVLHGGVLPTHTWEDLKNNIEICYIRNIDSYGKGRSEEKIGENWHKLYTGHLAYIASGHNAQCDGVPKFYNYSCNIDTAVYKTGILTCQIFDENGKDELIQIKGPARFPI